MSTGVFFYETFKGKGWLIMMKKLILILIPGLLMFVSFTLHAGQEKDLLDISSGAVVLTATSQYDEKWASLLILDGTTATGWCSAEGKAFPNTFIMELPRKYILKEFVVNNNNTQERNYPGISARRFVLYGSTESQKTGYSVICEGEASKNKKKVFPLDKPVKVKWLKLVIRSNWGNKKYTEIMELEAYGKAVEKPDKQKQVDGVYDTNYDLFRLVQDGNKIEGCYDYDNGRLSGETDGRVIRFQWTEDGPQIGTAVMVLSTDGAFLNGLWYEKGSYRGLWYGRRVTDGRSPICRVADVNDSIGKSLESTGRAILYGIYFEVDSAMLKPESTETLQHVLAVIKSKKSLNLVIEGHTDSRGSDKYNLELSRKRAQAVTDWLVKNGIDAARLNAKGYGESKPVADNSRPAGRALNRRVEISVSS
jgi:flagellar motor protein MotB